MKYMNVLLENNSNSNNDKRLVLLHKSPSRSTFERNINNTSLIQWSTFVLSNIT